ncbi:MAG: AI-2E family transporter [Rhodobacteraceae bacterium]|nr:AI-2E family transporter [Paracoccaceae bacterium]
MDTTLHQKAFLLLLALVTIAFFWILIPFYGAVFWAVILAIIFRPLQRALERRLNRRRNLAAALSVLVCILIAVLPMTVIVGSLVAEGAAVVQRIQAGELTPPSNLDEVFASLPPWAQTALDRVGIADFATLRERLASAVTQISQFLASQALNVGQNTLRFVASLGIMLYVLFFLFRDGPQIGRNIRAALPLSAEHSHALISKFAAVVRATVKGNVIIAVLQGTIGGVAFWALGIQGALLWGAMMAFLSLLPAVGAAIVWAPVAAYLMLSGDYLRGGVLIVVGVAAIGLVDNLLRPTLVGRETRLPDYVVLVSTLGGLSIFGINGFVIGPLIAALFVAGWTLFCDEQARRDA